MTNRPNKAPAPNRRPRLPLVGLGALVYFFRAPPAFPAAVGEARRSATQIMYSYLLSFSLVALLSTGCAHQKEQASASAHSPVVRDRTPRTAAPPAVVTNQFITTFGEHSVGGIWKVRVPLGERTVEVGAYGASMQPDGWRAQDGWFVLVENERRVWAYDGDRDLLLFGAAKNPEGRPAGSVGSLQGPTKFNCPVPDAVLARLSDAIRKAIKPND